MRNLKVIGVTFLAALGIMLLIDGCAATKAVADRSGAQLWAENCLRCHNSPSPADYSDSQWEAIGTHMRVRNNLTMDETEKVVAFLQSGN